MALPCIHGGKECTGCMACEQDPRHAGKCVACGAMIHVADAHYNFDGELVHEECLFDWARKYRVAI